VRKITDKEVYEDLKKSEEIINDFTLFPMDKQHNLSKWFKLRDIFGITHFSFDVIKKLNSLSPKEAHIEIANILGFSDTIHKLTNRGVELILKNNDLIIEKAESIAKNMELEELNQLKTGAINAHLIVIRKLAQIIENSQKTGLISVSAEEIKYWNLVKEQYHLQGEKPDFTYKPKISYECHYCKKFNRDSNKCEKYGISIESNHSCCKYFYLESGQYD